MHNRNYTKGYKSLTNCGQNFVWSVSWCDANYGCATRNRIFRSKVEALAFQAELESSSSNYVYDVEKVVC